MSRCLPRWKIDCRVNTMDADRYDEILCQMPNDRTLVQGIYSAGEILLMINTGHHSRVTRITQLQFFSGQFTKKGQYLSLEDFKGNFIINKVILLFSVLSYFSIGIVCCVQLLMLMCPRHFSYSFCF